MDFFLKMQLWQTRKINKEKKYISNETLYYCCPDAFLINKSFCFCFCLYIFFSFLHNYAMLDSIYEVWWKLCSGRSLRDGAKLHRAWPYSTKFWHILFIIPNERACKETYKSKFLALYIMSFISYKLNIVGHSSDFHFFHFCSFIGIFSGDIRHTGSFNISKDRAKCALQNYI